MKPENESHQNGAEGLEMIRGLLHAGDGRARTV